MSRLIASLLKGLIKFYATFISPIFPRSCRYTPTCSAYMSEAITIWGPLKGVWLGIKRILRCNPFGGSGFDPVPSRDKKSNSRA